MNTVPVGEMLLNNNIFLNKMEQVEKKAKNMAHLQ